MSETFNIAAYQFVQIEDCEALKEDFQAFCTPLSVKGIILISPEGINVLLSGLQSEVQSFVSHLRQDPRFKDIMAKESWSKDQPFGKLKIRQKGHIIPLSEKVNPEQQRGPTIEALELKRWIESGKDFVLLDVRNHYETEKGKFKNSKTLPIRNFRWFPEVMKELPQEEQQAMKDKPVVTVCTGGIKTEKATLWMLENGYKDVRLLDGGILKYLEQCGEDHFDGRCFVFDNRESLDHKLREPESKSQDAYCDKTWDKEKYHGRLSALPQDQT